MYNVQFLARSQNSLEYLLESTSTPWINSTLTIWGTDDITNEELEALKSFIKSIGKHRTYVDTSYDLNGKQKSVKKDTKTFTMVIMDILSLLFSKFE